MSYYFAGRTCRIHTTRPNEVRVHHQAPDGRSVCAPHNPKAAEHTFQPLGPGYVTCRRCDHYTHA
jgi:hypothetical protein